MAQKRTKTTTTIARGGPHTTEKETMVAVADVAGPVVQLRMIVSYLGMSLLCLKAHNVIQWVARDGVLSLRTIATDMSLGLVTMISV
jgi:hypothetical protein